MKQLRQPHTRLVFGLLLVDIIFFSITDPLKVPSPLLIVAFLLFSGTIYICIRALLSLVSAYGVPVEANSKRLALILTGVVGGLIALQSMGQLSSRDIAVLLPLSVLAYLYMSYGKASKDSLG